jgi:hypothetical protein
VAVSPLPDVRPSRGIGRGVHIRSRNRIFKGAAERADFSGILEMRAGALWIGMRCVTSAGLQTVARE